MPSILRLTTQTYKIITHFELYLNQELSLSELVLHLRICICEMLLNPEMFNFQIVVEVDLF
ncbi:hypothetical protein LEP1GSC127_1802 [Leptospira kirschneri str. 200801925]|nr:hypothetical protein LEP1GSC127_1802 [Leptospira kirschneri str. 200801925]